MRHLKLVLLLLVDFAILFGLWAAFVSNPTLPEMLAGLAGALIGTVANALVRQKRLVSLFPRPQWLAYFVTEPWYVIDGSWQIFLALLKRLAGKESEAQFRAVEFDPGGDDDESQARRALAITYTTIPPNFVVLGIDRVKRLMLVHQVSPTGTPWIAKKVGAKS
jgi:Na+/H+ ion antiporter subunit